MKKSFVYRALQIATAIVVYSGTSIWASTAHIHSVSETLTSLNSLLVILAIAFVFPYFCFKVLGKLTTPPSSRNFNDFSEASNSERSEREKSENIQEEIEPFQYRGTRYNPEDLMTNVINNIDKKNEDVSQPVIKYRGAVIENSSEGSVSDEVDSFSKDRKSQKSAQPKERIKYRGSYVD